VTGITTIDFSLNRMGYAGITATVEAGVEDLRQRHRFTEEWGLSETAVPERYGTVA